MRNFGKIQPYNGAWDNFTNGLNFLTGEYEESIARAEEQMKNMPQEQIDFLANQRQEALNELTSLTIKAKDEDLIAALIGSLATISYARTQDNALTEQYWTLLEPMVNATPLELYDMLGKFNKIVDDPGAVSEIERMRTDLYNQMKSMSSKEAGGKLPSPFNVWVEKNKMWLIFSSVGALAIGGYFYWRKR